MDCRGAVLAERGKFRPPWVKRGELWMRHFKTPSIRHLNCKRFKRYCPQMLTNGVGQHASLVGREAMMSTSYDLLPGASPS